MLEIRRREFIAGLGGASAWPADPKHTLPDPIA
jgi:hypothetical protein